MLFYSYQDLQDAWWTPVCSMSHLVGVPPQSVRSKPKEQQFHSDTTHKNTSKSSNFDYDLALI